MSKSSANKVVVTVFAFFISGAFGLFLALFSEQCETTPTT